MFPSRYFCNRYWAPRYWPKIGAEAAAFIPPTVCTTGSYVTTLETTGSYVTTISTTGIYPQC